MPELRHVDWSRLFTPRVVAVVGASDTEGTQQRAQWTQVSQRLGALGAEVIPVHPKKPDILGTRTYPSVTALPADPDLVIVLVRDPLPVVEEAVGRGAGFVVVFSAGFGELGTAEGDAAEAKLKALASGATRVLGPNTNLNIFEPWPTDAPSPKKLAIITQSGYQGRPITQAQALGVGIEIWATIGNEADLEWADFVGYIAHNRPGVGAIATYVEGFQNGRSFQLAADAAVRAGIPIVAIKVGRSEEGRVMAAAHTGHLTGADAVHDAVFEQYGVIRVDDLDEVIEISNMFCQIGLVPGDGGIAVYAMSGGTASHVADLFGAAGVKIPKFEQATVDALEKYIPWFLRRDNPVDSGGVITARPENREVLQLMLDDPNTDVLFAPITGVFPGMSDALSRDLIALHQKFLAGEGKPVVAAWISPIRDDSYRALCEAGVPVYHSFNAAVRGLSELGRFSRFARDYRSPFDTVPEIPAAAERAAAAEKGRALLAGAGATLNEVDSKALLSAYGIPVAGEAVATSGDEAVAAAAGFGYPVVMKIVSADIAHKSDLGLVAVGVADEDAVRATYDRLLATAASAAPQAAIDGVLVAQQVTDAVTEVILGLSHQHPFGPTITFGLGGVFTEVFKDVAFAVPPFDADHARAVIESTKGVKILRGTRGRPAGDLDALVDVILRLQALAVDLGDVISELDINPIMVRPVGSGVVAVDALVVPSKD